MDKYLKEGSDMDINYKSNLKLAIDYLKTVPGFSNALMYSESRVFIPDNDHPNQYIEYNPDKHEFYIVVSNINGVLNHDESIALGNYLVELGTISEKLNDIVSTVTTKDTNDRHLYESVDEIDELILRAIEENNPKILGL